ncbi:hypothetical protein COT49_03345 [candidate division WWE3 bacterium CG08_land_8_20_14_0_20_40_13]|uniref:TrpR like protein, YerC/YecD n=1 Tax=candidate division WWE3 bacterium CG08_land_8_20_14_0_20_40_13 TaxID=1975084 RepID=A0A2H0XFE2_UNCKA|nr:MAG: hypothetical protein COT49_03345 [candidate division WWE3 bacterium CG08_land_8_20_14_0_20_40_13]
MPRRYKNLEEKLVFSAFNGVRDSLLAAKNGEEVEDIIKSILTLDERIKIGRRVEVAWCLQHNFSYEEIQKTLHVGKGTISRIEKIFAENKNGFELIFERRKKVESEFNSRAYKKIGPWGVYNRRTEYTGFKRKDVKR